MKPRARGMTIPTFPQAPSARGTDSPSFMKQSVQEQFADVLIFLGPAAQ